MCSGEIAGVVPGVVAGGIAAVGARSPATMERFERALLDVTAVIGETFTPILEVVTEGVKLFGDVLASILPDASEMREIPSTNISFRLTNLPKPR